MDRELLTIQTRLPQDTMRVSVNISLREAVLLSCQMNNFEKVVDIANTLMARDWKGFGNQPMVGIIEYER